MVNYGDFLVNFAREFIWEGGVWGASTGERNYLQEREEGGSLLEAYNDWIS